MLTTPPPRVYSYEGMFLISQGVATDLAGAVAHIRQIIEKNGGTIVAMRKWDERRLTFEIAKQKRGLYILTYFQAPAPAMGAIERGFNLSEQVMRQLIVRVEHMTIDEMKAADGQRDLEVEARMRAAQPQPGAAPAAPAPAPAPVSVGATDEGDDEAEIG